MAADLDLSLPSHAPELGQYESMNHDDATFALYTLADLSEFQVQEVANALEQEWMDEMGTHLVRLAQPTSIYANKTLKDIVRAHVAMDKGIKPRSDGGAAGDISWWPTAFIVITKKDWKDPNALLFVLADDSKKGFPMDKFFFKLDDAYMMLSSLSFGDEYLGGCRELYDTEEGDEVAGK